MQCQGSDHLNLGIPGACQGQLNITIVSTLPGIGDIDDASPDLEFLFSRQRGRQAALEFLGVNWRRSRRGRYRSATLGITEPEHEIDAMASRSRIPGVSGNQLRANRAPEIAMTASLDLDGHVECAKGHSNIRPIVVGVIPFRLNIDT